MVGTPIVKSGARTADQAVAWSKSFAQIREILIAQKMKKWCGIAKWHAHRCPPVRARKNFWRQCARYPAIMWRLGPSELSVYR